jgi:hypothetical protein
LSPLSAFFGFDLSADSGSFFFFDLFLAEFLTLVFFDGGADFVLYLVRGFLEFALSLAESAGELGEFGASEQKEDDEKHDPDDRSVKYGEREVHVQIAIAVIKVGSNISRS